MSLSRLAILHTQGNDKGILSLLMLNQISSKSEKKNKIAELDVIS